MTSYQYPTHIVNLSIQQSTFPSLYKFAKVIPLLKKDDPLEAKKLQACGHPLYPK